MEKAKKSKNKQSLYWVIAAFVKYKAMLWDYLAASVALQFFGLALPAITQVVIDKIIPNKATSSLEVLNADNARTSLLLLVGAYCFIIVFQFVINFLRGYVSNQTTNKIDILLGGRLFRHLVNLPLVYFESRRIGDILVRINSLTSIREFLSGQAINSMLDIVFSVVYFSLMFWYSPSLTIIAFLAIPVQFLIAIFIQPRYFQLTEKSWLHENNSRAFMVEAVSSIQTIKAMAAEPQFNQKWENLTEQTSQAQFNLGVTGSFLENITQLVQKVTGVIILWYGGYLVISQYLSLGQLIAFSMLFGQISQPLGNVFNLWPKAQQAVMAVKRMNDIISTPQENYGCKRVSFDKLCGAVEFRKTDFGYIKDRLVLSGFSFGIAPGERVGIVGKSGSGKSTLAKLIQRLYLPESGEILIDGVNIAEIHPDNLREQIGVVLQENYLFKGSIRDNIALSKPAASMAEICAAAEIAGAHEFILELPEGYDTDAGEKGAELSGGQRQRIAIARALLTNPRILIFDEATSALDYQSERIIMDNMDEICAGRTVIIIAHRLSTVQFCDRIVVLDKGCVAEYGNHEQLLNFGGFYAQLYQQQQ